MSFFGDSNFNFETFFARKNSISKIFEFFEWVTFLQTQHETIYLDENKRSKDTSWLEKGKNSWSKFPLGARCKWQTCHVQGTTRLRVEHLWKIEIKNCRNNYGYRTFEKIETVINDNNIFGWSIFHVEEKEYIQKTHYHLKCLLSPRILMIICFYGQYPGCHKNPTTKNWNKNV